MDNEEDVYVDIVDESPEEREGDYRGRGIAETIELERWDGGSVLGDDDSDHYYSRYRYESRDYGGSRSYKLRSVVNTDLEGLSKHYSPEAEDKGRSPSARQEADSDEEEEQFSRRHAKHGSVVKEHSRSRTVVDDDFSDDDAEEEQFARRLEKHGSGEKAHSRNYRRKKVVYGNYSDDDEEGQLSSRLTKHGSGDKEHGKKYRRRSVIDEDYSDGEEEQYTKKQTVHVPGDKEHSRKYRRPSVVDDDDSDDGEGQFTRKQTMHGPGDKERSSNCRRRSVVDDDYSDDDDEEGQFTRKQTVHGSGEKKRSRNYRLRSVVDDYSDDEEDDQFTSKQMLHGPGDKERSRNDRRRSVVDDHYNDNDEEGQFTFTRKLTMHGFRDNEHNRNSKCRRMGDDGYSDDDEFVAKHSQKSDDFGRHIWHIVKKPSHRHSRYRDEDSGDDYIERERYRSRHRDDSQELKRLHNQDRHLKQDMERREGDEYMNERGRDADEDKYGRCLRGIQHSTIYHRKYDNDDDRKMEMEMEMMERERGYDYMKERGPDAYEDRYDRRLRGMHHSTRRQRNYDDDDWERDMMERERDYEFMKERGRDAEEDIYYKRSRDLRHLARYRSERDDDYWAWEQGRERMENSYEMKPMKREKYFKRQYKESAERTWNRELIERGKVRDVREQDGKCWAESREIDPHVQSRKRTRQMNFVGKELRVHMENKKDKEESHQRELADREIRKDSMEQERQKIDMSFQREFDENQKEREFRAWDPECMGKSQEIQRNKESKGGSQKMNFMETATIKWERETEEKNCGREEMNRVNKRYITERDVISKEDSHEREWDRVSREIIQKRDFYRRDPRKQGREEKLHVANETNFEDGYRGITEVSQEIELGRKTREGYQKSEFLDRDKWDSEDRQNIFETDAISLSNEIFVRNQNKEKNKERQYRGVDKEVRERSRSCAFVDRDTCKPDIEIRDKTLETEVMHRENERDLTTWDLDRESSQQEFFNEEENCRREVDKRSLEKILDNDSVDKENERDSRVRDSGSREKNTETTEGEKSKKLQEEQEEEKCRDSNSKHTSPRKHQEQHTETKDDEAEEDVGTESERQQKTVFAYQISLEADDRDIYNFFSKAGKVRDVLLVMNPISRHFMGVGHIEFYHAMSIPIAVSLSGQLLHGQPVMVKPLEADNNQVQSATDAVDCDLIGPCPEGTTRLCVGNLHDSISEALVRQVFEAFGAIELVQFSSAEAGHCERNCIIQFSCLEDARAALSLNGNLALAGQLIKVSTINSHDEMQVGDADANGCNEDEGDGLVLNIAVRNEMLGSDSKRNDSNEEDDSKMAPDRQPESALQELDPTDEQNNDVLSSCSPFKVDSLPLPSESLAHLVPPSIQAFATSLKTLLQVPGAFIPIVDTVGVPSECLLLKNMFESNMQTTDDFELRVKEVVDEKCYKFGKPNEIFADRSSAGCVYLRFEDTRIAIVAQRSLHGRWFDGKMITATFIAPQIYDSKVPNTEQASAQGQPPPAWPPQNYGASFRSSGQMLAQGQTPAMWLPQTYVPNFPNGQQALPPGPASSKWVPNNNPVAFGVGFGNGGQFMQPMMPQGNLIPDMRPNLW